MVTIENMYAQLIRTTCTCENAGLGYVYIYINVYTYIFVCIYGEGSVLWEVSV